LRFKIDAFYTAAIYHQATYTVRWFQLICQVIFLWVIAKN